MNSGAKTIDLRSNVVAKRYWGMRRAPQYFFEFFLGITLWEKMAIVCQKSLLSQNLTFGELWLPQY